MVWKIAARFRSKATGRTVTVRDLVPRGGYPSSDRDVSELPPPLNHYLAPRCPCGHSFAVHSPELALCVGQKDSQGAHCTCGTHE